jgi:hypothetical protein
MTDSGEPPEREILRLSPVLSLMPRTFGIEARLSTRAGFRSTPVREG